MKVPDKINSLILTYQKDNTTDITDLFVFCKSFILNQIKFNNYRFNNDKEDFIQDINISLLIYLNSFDNKKASFSSWFSKLIHNSYIKYYKAKQKFPLTISYYNNPDTNEETSVYEYLPAKTDIEETIIKKIENEFIIDHLVNLNTKYSYSIVYKDILGYSSKQTAKLLNTDEKYINTWRHRGRKILQQALTREER